MARTKTKNISITVSPKVEQMLDEGKYNRNKLIVSLLEKYLEK